MNISTTVEGRERYPISVRYAREYRDDPDALGQILVHPPGGGAIPLEQVADIEITTGPPMVRSEGGKLVGFVFIDIAEDQALGDYVERAKQRVAENVKLPPGTRLEWAGQFRYLERAREKLAIVIPITLALVFVLLFLSTRSVVETLIVLLAVPFSLIGAFWLLYLLDYNMSIAVWVGLIALAGLDAETGIVMLLYLKLAHKRRSEAGEIQTEADLREVIVEGAARRIRPKLMTVLTTMIGLTPILFFRRDRRRRHEADRRADGRRSGDLVLPRAHRLPRDLRHLEATGEDRDPKPRRPRAGDRNPRRSERNR